MSTRKRLDGFFDIDTERTWGRRTLDLILCGRPRLSSQRLRLL